MVTTTKKSPAKKAVAKKAPAKKTPTKKTPTKKRPRKKSVTPRTLALAALQTMADARSDLSRAFANAQGGQVGEANDALTAIKSAIAVLDQIVADSKVVNIRNPFSSPPPTIDVLGTRH